MLYLWPKVILAYFIYTVKISQFLEIFESVNKYDNLPGCTYYTIIPDNLVFRMILLYDQEVLSISIQTNRQDVLDIQLSCDLSICKLEICSQQKVSFPSMALTNFTYGAAWQQQSSDQGSRKEVLFQWGGGGGGGEAGNHKKIIFGCTFFSG